MGILDDPVAGTPGDDPTALVRPDDLVAAIARFLGRLHRSPVPVAGDGPSEVLDAVTEVERARRRVESGGVDASTFDAPYLGQSPDRLLGIATDLAGRLRSVPSVPVHGSLTLRGLGIAGGEVVGWPVVEQPPLGDRYVDLAAIATDLARAIGPAAVPALFDACAVERPDPLRLEVWVLLRQLR